MRLTDPIVLMFLLLSMDRRNVGGRMVARRVGGAGLLPMANEVLEVLDRSHLSDESSKGRRASCMDWEYPAGGRLGRIRADDKWVQRLAIRRS